MKKYFYKTTFLVILRGGISVALISFLSACAEVKGYQKTHLNDAEMELSARKIEKFEQSFQLYREGASGASGGKNGGGCGCN